MSFYKNSNFGLEEDKDTEFARKFCTEYLKKYVNAARESFLSNYNSAKHSIRHQPDRLGRRLKSFLNHFIIIYV